MRVLRLPVVRVFSTVAALLLAAACGSPANNGALFVGGGSSPIDTAGTAALEQGGGGLGSGGSGGVVSGSGAGGQLPSGGAASAPSGGAAGSSGGNAPNGGTAGSIIGGGGMTNGGMTNGGMTNGGSGTLTDCSMFGNGATYYAETKHCYSVVKMPAAFATAKSHCASLGAHLVTLASQQESDFVWSLDSNEHWIGATDGKGPREAGPGTYAWVDGEPFTYTDWSAGQPNASQTTCLDTMGGGMCYEHCAFQWAGGASPGEWNDRLCMHTIEAVCEWDG